MIYYILIITALIYLYQKWCYTYWTRKGVYQTQPTFLLGNVGDLIFHKRSIAGFLDKVYTEFKTKGVKYGGYYEMFIPRLIPIDLELIKHILQKDFAYFYNRGVYCDPRDPLSMHIFSLRNEQWKKLRTKLGPTVTKGRIKSMFPITKTCSEEMRIHLKESWKSRGYVDIHDIAVRFTSENFGAIAFGIDFNHITETNFHLLNLCHKNVEGTFKTQLKRLIACNFPESLLRKIGFKVHSPELTAYFMDLIKSVIQYREKNNIHKNDFMDVLLQLKNKGKITDDGGFTPIVQNGDQDGLFLSENDVVAQCFGFFIAAYETSSTTIELALFELAAHQDIQEKVIQEIQNMLENHDNELTFEGIRTLNYTEQVINETLRLHPSLPALLRVCTQNYKIPNSHVIIEEGTLVTIPVAAIHRDPEIYPDPEVFDPDRFSEENIATRHPMAFIPFGEGPRMCIGTRFGMTGVKIALATILRDFRVTLNKNTKLPLKYSTESMTTRPDDKIWIDLHPLK